MAVSEEKASSYMAERNATWMDEARCGKLGFSIVIGNMLAATLFIGSCVITKGFIKPLALLYIIIALPSIALFGLKKYFFYLFKPLQMVLRFSIAWTLVRVDQNSGIWKSRYAKWAHFYDERLSARLQLFFQQESAASILDLGCGTGAYVKALRNSGLYCDGCDGNPDVEKIAGCHAVNVAQKIVLRTVQGDQYDWVLSLEVGEHLPKRYEQIFLDNINNTAKRGVVLSWAKIGQGGLGHVNEQSNEFIEKEMLSRNWLRDRPAEEILRLHTSPHCFWFRETIMIFRRIDTKK